jgi:hypothetical protein
MSVTLREFEGTHRGDIQVVTPVSEHIDVVAIPSPRFKYKDCADGVDSTVEELETWVFDQSYFLVGWNAEGVPVLADLKKSCRLVADDVARDLIASDYIQDMDEECLPSEVELIYLWRSSGMVVSGRGAHASIDDFFEEYNDALIAQHKMRLFSESKQANQ